ncbi:MAG: helix-turn-helix domain-containing protein [Sedimentisphaeraceae bacterium JB056]
MILKERKIEKTYNRPQINIAGRFLRSANVQTHAHDFTELILVTQGHCTIQAQNKVLTGNTGTIFVIPPNTPHLQSENEIVGTSYIGFSYGPDSFDLNFRTIYLKNEPYIIRWVDDVIDLHTVIYDNKRYSQEVSGILRSILSRLSNIEHHQKTATIMHPKLRRAIEIIQEKFTQPLNLEQLSETLDLSSSYLGTLFNKHLGCGPIAYQQKLRMQFARKNLLNPYMTVTQVSQMCGYEDVNFFTRLFKKNYNISPGKWRDQFSESDKKILTANMENETII